MRSFNLRYAVYLSEIRKRFVYVVFSFVFAFLCAYTHRISLMYSITSCLQRAISERDGGLYRKSWEHSLPLFESIHTPLLSNRVDLDPRAAQISSTLEKADKSFSAASPHVPLPPKYTVQPEQDFMHDEGMGLDADSNVRLIFTDIEEAFYTHISISLFFCFLTCFPLLLYHTLCFFQPGVYAWQSQRAWLGVCSGLCFVCVLLNVVDSFVIPSLLRFFYSFKIERYSFSLQAETKVISYVSLYVFVHVVVFILLFVAVIWGAYKQRQILSLLLKSHITRERELFVALPFNKRDKASKNISTLPELQRYGDNSVYTRIPNQYKRQRGKVWWGCLLASGLVSPPEIFTQLAIACLFMFLSEISIWLAYTLSCRVWKKAYLCS